jgi:hypothetical protein
MKMNNRGSKILSVYWFAILVIVAVGIVAMVITFYGKPYDVREAEAGIMINKIADCLSDSEGKLKPVSDLEECHLDFGEKKEFYVEIEELEIKKGYFNLKENCDAVNVVCVEKKVYYLDSND